MLKKLLLSVVGLLASIGMAIAAVNVNTASEKELVTLPGVGPVKAKAIVEYRKTHGNFKSVDELKKVDGIGDKTFDDIKSQVAVSGATTAPAASAAKEKKETVKEAAKDVKNDVKAGAGKATETVKEAGREAKADAKALGKDAKAEVKSAAAVVDSKAEKAKDSVKDTAKEVKADTKAAAKSAKSTASSLVK